MHPEKLHNRKVIVDFLFMESKVEETASVTKEINKASTQRSQKQKAKSIQIVPGLFVFLALHAA